MQGKHPDPIVARRRALVRALFEKGMKPRQIFGHVRREFGVKSVKTVYRDITLLRRNGTINSQAKNKAQDEDLDRRCLELKKAGNSYNAIARALGISRNAVAGRLHRMRAVQVPAALAGKPAAPQPQTGNGGDCDLQPVCAAPLGKDNAWPQGAPTAVMTARPGTCRWPVGDPRDAGFRFCGAKALAGSPWCAGHAARAWEKDEGDAS